ncbi:MAG: hypothetical protein J7J98_02335 [candidate division Zixibacteria bacterium]|nr:hypothetical protein [candidate division Zixibacteria bacterium]
MRQLVLLVCVATSLLITGVANAGNIIPTLESKSGKIGFYPISNEISYYRNYDDTGESRGQTLQIVAINGFKLITDFTFEFTADYNWDYSYADPFDLAAGMNARDHYVELSLVKPVTSFVSLNIQRVISTFELEPINQFGVRLVF